MIAHGNQVHGTMFNAGFRYQALRHMPYLRCAPPKHHGLGTSFGIDMYMHRRNYHREVVMLMIRESLRKLPFLMIEDITHHSNAVPRFRSGRQNLRCQFFSQQIPKSFRSIAITSSSDQFV